jgi:hypothetical protein
LGTLAEIFDAASQPLLALRFPLVPGVGKLRGLALCRGLIFPSLGFLSILGFHFYVSFTVFQRILERREATQTTDA